MTMNKGLIGVVLAAVVIAAGVIFIQTRSGTTPETTNGIASDVSPGVIEESSQQLSVPTPADTATTPQYDAPPPLTIDANATYTVTMTTNKGAIELELFVDEAPVTVNNFVFLSQEGFYDGTTFHRIVEGFMIQGGDPSGDGTGGPGYTFADEPVTREYDRGIIAMANRGPDTNGSQFFIMHADNPQLPKQFTIFGQVTQGIDIVDAIAQIPVATGPSGEQSVPQESVVVEAIEIVES